MPEISMQEALEFAGIGEPHYADGEPCDHPGCCNHVTHSCEGCGRIGCRNAQPSVGPDKPVN